MNALTKPTAYIAPARMTTWTDADYEGQPLAKMLGIAPLLRPAYVSKGGDMTPEQLAAFAERAERTIAESQAWPLPTFGGREGAGAAARAAIEASESKRLVSVAGAA